MLDRLTRKSFYCFLDGYSRYNHVFIASEDQHNTTFTCPFDTFAFRRMPFELCNAPTTFQRYMMSIFSNIVEKLVEVFMNDFLVHGDTFESCLKNANVVLRKCVKHNLVLNWEKCNFMVKKEIVLGHKVTSHIKETREEK